MKIDGSSANSINFIEQKYSNTSTNKHDIQKNRTDTFESKSMNSMALLESNESMAMLQIAHSSIIKLQNSGEELQKLNDKFSFFQSQKSELNEKFEEITVSMLDIIDNTMFKDGGLFYVEHNLSIGDVKFSFSMVSENSIEDFELGSSEELDSFILSLGSIEDNILDIKRNIEVANFNQMAVLDKNSSRININASMFSNQNRSLSLSTDDIKQAHNTSLLKDKVSFLLD